MSPYICAFLIGVIAGLRSLTAPAVVCWAAHRGRLYLDVPGLRFLASAIPAYVLGVLAIGELIADKLPKTPSRKAAVGFTARLITGGFSGAVLSASESMVAGAIIGAFGAVIGTLGGYEARVRLAKIVGSDLPVALLEDAIAVGGAFWIVSQI